MAVKSSAQAEVSLSDHLILVAAGDVGQGAINVSGAELPASAQAEQYGNETSGPPHISDIEARNATAEAPGDD